METTTIVSNIATAVSAVVAAVALLLTYLKYRKKEQMEHAEQVLRMLDKTRNDKEILKFFQMIDYNQHWYNKEFPCSEMELIVDTALHYYEYALYLREQGLLDEKEFLFFEYDINRILGNHDLSEYFRFLFNFSASGNLSFKYKRLLDYGIKMNRINKEFIESYSKYDLLK